MRSIATAPAAIGRFCPGPRRGPQSRTWSRASCSATSRGRSPAPTQPRPGLLALADGGTVFLDELADIPLAGAGEAAARAGAQRGLPGRRQSAAAAQHPHPRRDASGPGAQRRRGTLSPRPLLSAERLPDPPAAAARAPGDIVPLAEHFLRRFEPAAPLLPETLRHLSDAALVRQRARAAQRAGTRRYRRPGRPAAAGALPQLAAGAEAWHDRVAAALQAWLSSRLADGGGEPAGLYQELLRLMEHTLLAEVLQRVRRAIAGRRRSRSG